MNDHRGVNTLQKIAKSTYEFHESINENKAKDGLFESLRCLDQLPETLSEGRPTKTAFENERFSDFLFFDHLCGKDFGMAWVVEIKIKEVEQYQGQIWKD